MLILKRLSYESIYENFHTTSFRKYLKGQSDPAHMSYLNIVIATVSNVMSRKILMY
jgi:hypothetical protein